MLFLLRYKSHIYILQIPRLGSEFLNFFLEILGNKIYYISILKITSV